MKVLKFRPAKKKSKEKDKKEEDKKPSRNYKEGTATTRYCFGLVASGLKQDNKDEVAANLLTWLIVNSSQETLTRFIDWIVKEDK